MGFFDGFDDNTEGACGLCPLRTKCNKLGSLIVPNSDIMVVLERPTMTEHGTASSFTSPLFRSFLSLIPHYIFEKMSFTYAVRGYSEGDSIHSDVYKTCSHFLTEDFIKIKPKVVLGLGQIALNWANSSFDSIFKFNQTPFFREKGGSLFWYFPVYSIPATIGLSKHPRPFDIDFKNSIKSFINFYKNIPDIHVENSYNDNIKLVSSSDDLEREMDLVFEAAKDTGTYPGVDFETEGTAFYHKIGLLTASIGCKERTIAFSVNHPSDPNPKALQLIGKKLRENDWIHHSPYELLWLACLLGEDWLMGAFKKVSIYDTMPYARIIHSRSGILDLGTQTDIHLGFNVKKLSHVDASKPWQSFSLWEWLSYNALDSKYDSILFDHYCTHHPLDDNLMKEYLTLCELSVPFVIAHKRGLSVDMKEATRLHTDFSTKQENISHEIYSLDVVKEFMKRFGSPFKIGSSQDVILLMKTFYDLDMKRKSKKSDKEDKETADEEMLTSIPESLTPLGALILDYRHLDKSLSTYIKPIIDRKILYPDGKIHPSYGTVTVITGRRNSKGPNIQNFPSRTEKFIRNMVCADPGEIFIAFDYGQLEARVLAMASKDPKLVEYQRTDYDIHARWRDITIKEYPKYIDVVRAKVGDLPEEKLMKSARTEIKTYMVFASLYGSTSDNCADSLGIPRDVMQNISNMFWEEFKGVLLYRKHLQNEYEKSGFVYNILRTRKRGGIVGFNEMINYPIQSTASDIVRSASIRLVNYSFENNMPWLCPRIEIHDDLTFSVPEDREEEVIKTVSGIMLEPVFDFINVPLIVEPSVGKLWGSLKSGDPIKGRIFGDKSQ